MFYAKSSFKSFLSIAAETLNYSPKDIFWFCIIKFVFVCFPSVAELERSMIIERTQAGKEVARTKNGFREGRPPLPEKKLLYALELLKDHSYKEVIDITGISKATLCRAKQKYSGLRP